MRNSKGYRAGRLKRRGHRLLIETLESRSMLAGDLQSPYQPLDVNIDLSIEFADAAAVIQVLESGAGPNGNGQNGAGQNGAAQALFPDVNGNGAVAPVDALIVLNQVYQGGPSIAARLSHDSAPGDQTNFDRITRDPGIEARINGAIQWQAVTIDELRFEDLSEFVTGSKLQLSAEDIDSMLAQSGKTLIDGEHRVRIDASDAAASLEFQITVDRTPPSVDLMGGNDVLSVRQRVLTLQPNEALGMDVMLPNLFEVRRSDDLTTIAIEQVESEPSTDSKPESIVLRFADVLDNGDFELRLSDKICDLAGNPVALATRNFRVQQAVQMSLDPVTQLVRVEIAQPTASVAWDRVVQQAVINLGVGPTIGSRAYAMMHTAMFDAWSAYDQAAVSTQLGDSLQRPVEENTDANKRVAMSHAAYRVLIDLFPDQVDLFDTQMQQEGLVPDTLSRDATTAVGIGNQMAEVTLNMRHRDGSNQLGDSPNGDAGIAYSDHSAYDGVNSVGDTSVIDRWTPERVPIDATPSEALRTQQVLTPQWGQVIPFAISDLASMYPQPPQPFLLVDGQVDLDAATITLGDGTVRNIDSSLVGTIINPAFIEQAQQLVSASANLTDQEKMIAEFWEDGSGTSFPPGTWMSFAQFVSGRDSHTLDDDAKMFFAVSNAVFDAGIAAWHAKTHYDYVRPVRAIRELGELGLLGQYDAQLGGYAIDAWVPGGGTQRILATDFLTYQTPGSDPSPPFPEYTSGHSGFSAAAATVLEQFTGNTHFGGAVSFAPGTSRFEPNITPASTVDLIWDTFHDAADQAGVSRIYGGIHFSDGDINGRHLGDAVGMRVWNKAQQYITGNVQ